MWHQGPGGKVTILVPLRDMSLSEGVRDKNKENAFIPLTLILFVVPIFCYLHSIWYYAVSPPNCLALVGVMF